MYKLIFFLVLFLHINIHTYAQQHNTFTDKRDGRKYKITQIGNQWWMAENLSYKVNKYLLDYGNKKFQKEFGFLDTFEQTLDVCPVGWHIPTEQEWDTLASFIQNENNYSNSDDFSSYGIFYYNNVGQHLKSKTGWKEDGNGTNKYLFNAKPAGYHNYEGYVKVLDFLRNGGVRVEKLIVLYGKMSIL